MIYEKFQPADAAYPAVLEYWLERAVRVAEQALVERDGAQAHLAAQVTANQMLAQERDGLQNERAGLQGALTGTEWANAEWQYANKLLAQELDSTKKQLAAVFAQRNKLAADLADGYTAWSRLREAQFAAVNQMVRERDEAVQQRDCYRAQLVAAGLLDAA